MSQLPMYPPQQHDVVGPDSQGTPARKITRPWLAYLQSLTTNVVNSVTHTGALVLNRLIVGNGGQDIRAEALSDGQIPIGATSDGTVQPATITAGANIAVTNGSHSIEIAATGVVTGPAGANTDIQYNDSGVFGGDANLTWDKTNQRITITGSANASAAQVVQNSSEIALSPSVNQDTIYLGMKQDDTGAIVPIVVNPAYIFRTETPVQVGMEADPGQSPPTPDPFAQGIGFQIAGSGATEPFSFEAYQYGGLGTGAVPGMAILADRNDSGGGATGVIGGQLKDGRWFVIWADATGAMRYSIGALLDAIRQTEDNSVSDTSGTLFATGQAIMTTNVFSRRSESTARVVMVGSQASSPSAASGNWVPLALGTEPLQFVSDGAGNPVFTWFAP